MRAIEVLTLGQRDILTEVRSTYVRQDVYDETLKTRAAEKVTADAEEERHVVRLTKLESKNEWMFRLLLGTLATSVAGVITELIRIRN